MEFLNDNWLGILGLASGLLCVWLLIKENIYTFPIGLLYAAITVVVMLETRLYADVLLNGYYVVMNAYGWYFWLRGSPDRVNDPETGNLAVAALPVPHMWRLALITLAGTAVMGAYFDNYTDADFAYLDSLTTTASFVAMWMSARKYLESWIVWFAVDVISVGLYLTKAQVDATLYYYAFLYLVYLWMAVIGYRAWRRQLTAASTV